MLEQTFLMIKPDGVKRKLIGCILNRLERKGLNIVEMKMIRITRELAEKHYQEHKEKDFYEDLIKFIISGPVVALIIEGDDVVDIIHKFAGKTNPKDAKYGTIRGDYANNLTENVVHTSDSLKSAEKEIQLFFGK